MRTCKSPSYNWIFDEKTGNFARWGKNKDIDPVFSPCGPEILDFEVSTVCTRGCKMCYKANTEKGNNTSLDKFIEIGEKLPKNLTQIAFGVGDLCENDDLWAMMEWSRKNNIVPNITINGHRMSDQLYELLAHYCGAISVSYYDYKCYSVVENLKKAGATYVNIHKVLDSEETAINFLKYIPETTIQQLHAVVFLLLKPKGRAAGTPPIPNLPEIFRKLVELGEKRGVGIGADSCSANYMLDGLQGHPKIDTISKSIEPCESGLFSIYANVDGEFFPCSFAEGQPGWETGLKVENSFMDDIWFHPRMNEWREKLISIDRKCPLYQLGA